MLEIRLFGIPRIILSQQLLKIPRRKTRAVLYYLAAQDGAIHREKLLGVFWPDEPRVSAQQVLRTTLHGLRQSLGDHLVARDEYVSLGDEVQVDTRMFEAGLVGVPFDPEQWGKTLGLYRGDFLEEVDLPDNYRFDDWIVIERERYRRMAVRALTALSDWHEAQQEYEQALIFLDQALSSNPLQEDLQRESIRLHYLAGDRPGAIRRYDELRRLLDREMGVPPMVETRALYDAILNDRSLPQGPSTLKRSNRLHSKLGATAPENKHKRLPSDSRLHFSGRTNELKLIQEGLRGNHLVLIEGEPGIGKTRLVEEYLTRLDNTLLIKCRAHELEQNLPYQPIIEALRALIDHPDWNYLLPLIQREVPPVWRAEVGRLLPEQRELLEGVFNLAIGVDEPRLWEGIYQFLAVVSRYRPFVVFIDDIHWADNSSIGLLGYLVRQKYPGKVGIIVAARPFSVRSTLMSLVQALIRDGLITRIHLNRLTQEDVQTIVTGIRWVKSDQIVNWLYQTSEGNPFIISELVRSMSEAGRDGNRPLGSQPTGVDVTPVPKSVYSLIQTRLTQLSEPARRVLDASVAAGRDFDFQIVLLASGLSEAATVDAIDELVAAGLIISQAPFHFSFDHHLTMEVALEEVGELRHRLLHRRVAEALESIHREQPGEIAGLLAWHFQEGNAPEKAAPYAFQAGKEASKLAAWNEAISFYETALNGFRGAQRLPVLIALGEALDRFGQYVRSTEAYREAIALMETHNAKNLRDKTKIALARTLLPQARFNEAIDQAREVLSDGDLNEAVTAEVIWGTALSIEGADLEEAKAHLHAARNLWEHSDDCEPLTLAQIKFELGSLTAQQGDLQLAVQYYRESLTAASQSGLEESVVQRILAYNNLAYHLLLLNDPTALGYANKGLELAREKGVMAMQAYLMSTLGEIALANDSIEEAEKYFNAGMQIAESFGIQERVAGLTANLGLIALKQDQIPLAIHLLSRALGLAESLGTHHLSAQIRIWLVPHLPRDQALQHLAEARVLVESSGRQRLLDEIISLEKIISDQES